MRLIDGDALLEKAVPQNPDAKFHCVPVEDIEAAPTIEARKKGRWINHRSDEGHNIADCSDCGATIQWFDDDDIPNFCCMCGADMREEGDE